MTDEEKKTAMNELMGFTKVIDETPEFLQTRLEEFRKRVEQISNKTAYLEAQIRIPKTINSDEFQLMFLRAARFNTEVRNSNDE